MGMDVYGTSPKSEAGTYFRNNVWYWHPLWEYCCEVAGDIISEEAASHGHYNDGVGLDEEQSIQLANRLKEEIYSGRTLDYQNQRNHRLANLPRSECSFCEGTGIRSDEIGKDMHMDTKVLTDEEALFLGRTHGWCNGCRGEGLVDDWNTSYVFTVENVDSFSMFLQDCGGFKIY